MAKVHILQTDRNKYYIGSTTDIEKRMRHHEGGFTPSTKKLGRPRLVFSQEYQTLKEARAVEKKSKKLKRRDYIEKIISDGIIKIRPV